MKRSPHDKENTHLLRIVGVVILRVPLVLLVALLCGLSGVGFVILLPKQYKAISIIEIAGGDQMQVFAELGEVSGDPRLTSTHLAVMTSGKVLSRAGEILEEAGRAGRKELPEFLRRSVSVRMVPNTPLLQIVAKGATPEEASSIANAVVDGYRETREKSENERARAGMEALGREVEVQRRMVEQSADALKDLAVAAGVFDLNPYSNEVVADARDRVLISLEGAVAESKTEALTRRTLSDQLGKIDNRGLFGVGAAMGLSDPTNDGLSVAIREVEAEISRMLGAGLGALHPKTLALRAKLSSHLDQEAEQAGAMRRALESRTMAAEEEVLALESSLEEEKRRWDRERGGRSAYEEGKAELLLAKKVLSVAEDKLLTGAIQSSMPRDTLMVWERAEAGSAMPATNVPMAVVVCLSAGFALGIAMAFFMDYLDTSARTVQDVEAALDTSMLCVVPSGGKPLTQAGWGAQDAEPYQMLRLAVEGGEGFQKGFSLAVTSGAAGEGKSTTSANLACAFASGGYRVLVVDCDLRRPSQHKIFGVQNENGVGGMKSGGRVDILSTRIPGVSLVCSGSSPADPEAVLSSESMTEFLKRAKFNHDIVILDAPPILGLGDAGILSKAADRTLVVVHHRRFPSRMLGKVKACLEAAGARVAGAVLNDTNLRHDENFDRYTGYYGYYPARREYQDCY